jgi:hypothetical protein
MPAAAVRQSSSRANPAEVQTFAAGQMTSRLHLLVSHDESLFIRQKSKISNGLGNSKLLNVNNGITIADKMARRMSFPFLRNLLLLFAHW